MSDLPVLPKAAPAHFPRAAIATVATLHSRLGIAVFYVALALLMCVISSIGLNPVATLRAAAAEAGSDQIISAKTSHERAKRGELILVDIRHPDEWRETGVPASGHAITMHQSKASLLEKMVAIVGSDKNKPVALICAAGSRSAYLQDWLRGHGFTNVMNVAEGMVGGEFGAGWVKSGLPTKAWSGPAAK